MPEPKSGLEVVPTDEADFLSSVAAWSNCRRRPPPNKASASQRHGRGQEVAVTVVLPPKTDRCLLQVRCCFGGFVTLTVLRWCAASMYACPSGSSWTANMLSCAADILAAAGSVPALSLVHVGACVQSRCLGSLLTLLLTALMCDMVAVVMFLGAGDSAYLGGPIAIDEGAPALVAYLDAWECILLSSVSLQVALCVSAWQLYRICREAGLYPSAGGGGPLRLEVSPLEFLCEAEDVALLNDQCGDACMRNRDSWSAWQEAAAVDEIPHLRVHAYPQSSPLPPDQLYPDIEHACSKP